MVGACFRTPKGRAVTSLRRRRKGERIAGEGAVRRRGSWLFGRGGKGRGLGKDSLRGGRLTINLGRRDGWRCQSGRFLECIMLGPCLREPEREGGLVVRSDGGKEKGVDPETMR